MKRLFYLSVLLLSFSIFLKSQNNSTTIYQQLPVELPTSMVNYDNFSLIVSTSINYCQNNSKEGGDLILTKIDLNGNVLFRKSIKVEAESDFLTLNNSIKCLPTFKKGLYTLNKANYCNGIQNIYTLVDSTGKLINNYNNTYPGDYKDIGIVNGSFFYLCDPKNIYKINYANGQLSNNPFYVTTSTIVTTENFDTKRIIVETGNALMLIDTIGNLYKQKANNINYSSIKHFNNFLYCYSKTASTFDKIDTNLNVVKSLTIDPTFDITDYHLSNDTIYTVLFNNLSNHSSIRLFDTSLNTITTKSVNIDQHKIISIRKKSVIHILSYENNAKYSGSRDLKAFDCGYFKINSLNDYAFDHDLEITNLQNISLDSVKKYGPSVSNITYYYTNEITIKNNSNNFVNSFKLFEDYSNKPTWWGNTNLCNSYDLRYLENKIINTPISPQNSITIQIKGIATIYTAVPTNSNNININFSYYVSLPNGQFENNIINSSITNSLHLEYIETPSTPIVIPNPTNKIINVLGLNATSPISIYDIAGKLVIYSAQNKDIDLSALGNGIYFVKYEQNGILKTTKLLKTD